MDLRSIPTFCQAGSRLEPLRPCRYRRNRSREMEGYIKYRANKMLRMLGLSEIYPEFTDNPMNWIRAYVDSFDDTKTDFFEQTSRQYVKTSDLNGFDDL